MLVPGSTVVSLNLEAESTTLGFSSESTSKEGGAILAGAVCLDYQENNCVAALLWGIERNMSGMQTFLGSPLVLLSLVVRVNGKTIIIYINGPDALKNEGLNHLTKCGNLSNQITSETKRMCNE